MSFVTHNHFYFGPDTDSLERKLDKALKLLKNMAKKTEEIKAALAEQAGIITNLAGDMDRIADRLENDPTEDELEEIAADIRSKNEQLRTLADRNIVAENHETPEEPTPTTES